MDRIASFLESVSCENSAYLDYVRSARAEYRDYY